MKIDRFVLSGLAVAALLVMSGANSLAQELFRDEMTSGAGWGSNVSSSDTQFTFNYDYSADGIPEAPNAGGGDAATRGVKLEANLTSSAAQFFTLYPTGQNFTGNYQLRFDAWMNYDADEVAFGTSFGTTEFLGGGIGYDNVTADIASGAQAMATGEAGTSNDWQAFKSPPQFFIQDAGMAAGSHNASDAYYTAFLPSVAPPASQSQSSLGIEGSPGFQWITWQFTASGGLVTVDIEKPGGAQLRIVDIDCNDTSDGSAGCGTDGNISLFYADFFDSVTPFPTLTFGIIDNVLVTAAGTPGDFDGDGDVDGKDFLEWQKGNSPNLGNAADLAIWEENYGNGVGPIGAATAVPEPASCALFALGAFALASGRRRHG